MWDWIISFCLYGMIAGYFLYRDCMAGHSPYHSIWRNNRLYIVCYHWIVPLLIGVILAALWTVVSRFGILQAVWYDWLLPALMSLTMQVLVDVVEHFYPAIPGFISSIAFVAVVIGLIIAFVRRSHTTWSHHWFRNYAERDGKAALFIASILAILTTVGIVVSLLAESIYFFQKIGITEFLFGLEWSPQTSIRVDQVASEGRFGIIPLLTGTLLIMAVAIIVAFPVGLLSAVYLSEFASKKMRDIFKPVLEILAGIPTVVYGFFAALTVAPFLKNVGGMAGISVSSESALAAGIVMGIMIIPFISSLSDDVINAVPQSLRDGSSALGATETETITKVVLPAAMPGVIAALMLACSRAIGETMIVVMAAGIAANLTLNPLSNVTTFTVQIVMLLKGDQEFDSAKTLSVFALGLVLLVMTLLFNLLANYVVRRFKEKYA